MALQKTIRAMDQEHDVKYANLIKTDVAKEKQEAEERAKKTRDYRTALKKQ